MSPDCWIIFLILFCLKLQQIVKLHFNLIWFKGICEQKYLTAKVHIFLLSSLPHISSERKEFHQNTYLHLHPKCKTHTKLGAWIYGSLASVTVSLRRHTLLLIFFLFHLWQNIHLSLHPACPLSSLLSSLLLQSFSVRLRGEYSRSSIDHWVLISDWGHVGKTGVQWSWLREKLWQHPRWEGKKRFWNLK